MNENDIEKPKTAEETKKSPIKEPPKTPVLYTSQAPQKISHKLRTGLGGLALIILCFLAAFGGSRLAGTNILSTDSNSSANSADGNQIVTKQEKDITSVVSKVSPSVVSIIASGESTPSIFGDSTQSVSAGTGMVISKDGYIITNHHVIGGASSVTVVLSDGTTYKNVKVVGSDPLNDVAFLKINGVSTLKPVSIGNSSTVRVGQQVVAIGNSLGQYQNTVTSGILSGTGRPVSAQDGGTIENLSDLLQTDAAINPGNSGGPLLNIAGQVIGINTAVAQNAQGIGFAIPINATKGEIASVIAGKGVKRSYVGLKYVTITPDVADQFNLSVNHGAYVHDSQTQQPIIQGSPADNAGIQNDDVILEVNGQQIGSAGSLSSLVGEYQPGTTVKLKILRHGKTLELSLKLGTYSSDTQ